MKDSELTLFFMGVYTGMFIVVAALYAFQPPALHTRLTMYATTVPFLFYSAMFLAYKHKERGATNNND